VLPYCLEGNDLNDKDVKEILFVSCWMLSYPIRSSVDREKMIELFVSIVVRYFATPNNAQFR
jgi:hypothetical protein